jgi:hypothetical protein
MYFVEFSFLSTLKLPKKANFVKLDYIILAALARMQSAVDWIEG